MYKNMISNLEQFLAIGLLKLDKVSMPATKERKVIITLSTDMNSLSSAFSEGQLARQVRQASELSGAMQKWNDKTKQNPMHSGSARKALSEAFDRGLSPADAIERLIKLLLETDAFVARLRQMIMLLNDALSRYQKENGELQTEIENHKASLIKPKTRKLFGIKRGVTCGPEK